MPTPRPRSVLARFRALRWPVVVMLLLILTQSVGVAACFDHDLRANAGQVASAPVDVAAVDAVDPSKPLVHAAGACSHCVCPHFVALPASVPRALIGPAPSEAVVSERLLHSNALQEETLRPPAAV